MSSNANYIDYEELNSFSPWITTDGIDWSCITKGLTPKKYSKNSIVCYQDSFSDYVYLVKDGRVHLDICSQNGEEKTLYIAVEGTLIGELSPVDGLPNICSAIAAVDSILYLIPKATFINEMKTNCEFVSNLLYLYTKKIRYLAEDIKHITFNNSYYRVCNALVHLAKQYGTKSESGHKLNVKFTHQEMANLTGLSRVSVSNIISDMGSQGILKKEDGYLIIKDIYSILSYVAENT